MAGNKQAGFIKTILVIIIALVILGFFGYNLESIVSSETVKANLAYVWNLLVTLWENVLAAPVLWVWNKIVVGLVWNNLQAILNRGQ